MAPISNWKCEYIMFLVLLSFLFPQLIHKNVSTEVFFRYMFLFYLCTSSEFWTIIGTVQIIVDSQERINWKLCKYTPSFPWLLDVWLFDRGQNEWNIAEES